MKISVVKAKRKWVQTWLGRYLERNQIQSLMRQWEKLQGFTTMVKKLNFSLVWKKATSRCKNVAAKKWDSSRRKGRVEFL